LNHLKVFIVWSLLKERLYREFLNLINSFLVVWNYPGIGYWAWKTNLSFHLFYQSRIATWVTQFTHFKWILVRCWQLAFKIDFILLIQYQASKHHSSLNSKRSPKFTMKESWLQYSSIQVLSRKYIFINILSLFFFVNIVFIFHSTFFVLGIQKCLSA
jgi:hypothetical protein